MHCHKGSNRKITVNIKMGKTWKKQYGHFRHLKTTINIPVLYVKFQQAPHLVHAVFTLERRNI